MRFLQNRIVRPGGVVAPLGHVPLYIDSNTPLAVLQPTAAIWMQWGPVFIAKDAQESILIRNPIHVGGILANFTRIGIRDKALLVDGIVGKASAFFVNADHQRVATYLGQDTRPSYYLLLLVAFYDSLLICKFYWSFQSTV